MFFAQLGVFICSAAINFALVYFKVPISNLQQIISIVLIGLLIFLTRLIFAKSRINLSKKNQLGLLFLTSLLTQLLIISSGSLYSPFLILLHINTLTIAFLLNVASSITFLILSVVLLISQVILDQNISSLFKADPTTAILYGVSFLVIIPIGQYLAKTYRIKDALSNILSEYLHIGELREESILSGLNELVIITDKVLNILSASEAVEKLLQLSPSELINKQLLKVLSLKDINGVELKIEQLPVKNILDDKAVRIVKDLYLNTPFHNQLMKIVAQIKPVVDSKGEVNQLVFIISDARLYGNIGEYHSSLHETLAKHQKMLEELKKGIASAKLPEFAKRIEILDHIEEDILTALELEDHSIKENISFEDIAYLSQLAISGKQALAQSLGVKLQFILPKDEVSETSLLNLRKSNLSKEILGTSNFALPTDPKWLQLIIQKLLDIAILLSAGGTKQVQLDVNREAANLNVIISIPSTGISQKQAQGILEQHYGGLGVPTLSLGSGIEGFIAKTIASRLNIPIVIKVNADKLVFLIKLNKTPK